MFDLDADQLDATADEIMHIDGDKDHMSQSCLNCEQTQAVARFLRALARKIRTKEDGNAGQ